MPVGLCDPRLELLGPFGILFFVGLAMFFGGAGTMFVILGRYGGLDRSRTLSVVFDDDSTMKKPGARGDRIKFRIGVFVAAFGMMTLFTGLSVGDARELRVCDRRCMLKGLGRGAFAPSGVDKDAKGKPLRGCFCVSAAGSTELRPEALPGLPSR